jgi:hypothetical protein
VKERHALGPRRVLHAPTATTRAAERARELHPTKPTVDGAVRKFFGYSASSKSNVTRLLIECRRRGFLPPKAGDSPEVVTASETLHDTVSAEEFEARTLVQVLGRVAQQGGTAGHYAAALLDELQRPSAEQPAALEVDVDGLCPLFPPLWPVDGSPPKPSALRGILNRVKEYQRAFDRFAVS